MKHLRSTLALALVAAAATVAAADNGATTAPGDPLATTGTGVTAAIERIVEVTQTVQPGAAVTGFTVPAGRRLVVTDVVVTNPSATPSCGASVAAGAAPPAGDAANGAADGAADGAVNGADAGQVDGAVNGPVAGAVNGATTGTANGSANGSLGSTGLLCVPAQTSLVLALATGLEFGGGQAVLLANQPPATPASPSTPGPLAYHLRGLLVTSPI